jgi:peptide/nickel transport system substrate-binding protein
MGPLFFLGQGGVTWNPLYDMSLFSTPDGATNYQSWTDQRWFDDWKLAIDADTVEAARPIINRMLKLFYGVSNRIDWTPRRDEEIELFAATLK